MPDLAAAMGQILPEIINRHEGSNRVVEWYLRNCYQKSAFRKGVFCYVRLSGGALLPTDRSVRLSLSFEFQSWRDRAHAG